MPGTKPRHLNTRKGYEDYVYQPGTKGLESRMDVSPYGDDTRVPPQQLRSMSVRRRLVQMGHIGQRAQNACDCSMGTWCDAHRPDWVKP